MKRKEIDLYQPKRQAMMEARLYAMQEECAEMLRWRHMASSVLFALAIVATMEALVIISIW